MRRYGRTLLRIGLKVLVVVLVAIAGTLFMITTTLDRAPIAGTAAATATEAAVDAAPIQAFGGQVEAGFARVSLGIAPGAPTLNAPADGATGVSTSPALAVGVSDPNGDPITVTYYGQLVTPPPAPDFTVVALPDTQHYVDNIARNWQFAAQTQWVVDSETALNLRFQLFSWSNRTGRSATDEMM